MYFSGKDYLCFFDGRVNSYLWEKEMPSLPNIQKISYFHVIFEKDHLLFSFRKKNIIFSEKRNAISPDDRRKIMFQGDFFEKTIFSEHLKNISYFHAFFRERSSFIFCLKNKIIFSGKRNIIFPDDTRKIIFQCNFFEKTIFSKHFEKENMFFRAVICLTLHQ